MKTRILILTLALSASTGLLTAQEGDPPREGQRPPRPEGGPEDLAGPGERRGPQLMPPRVAEQLNLTSEQREQVAKLDADVKAKMEKILTPEQLQQFKQTRPPLRERVPTVPNSRMGGPGGPPNALMGDPGMMGGMGVQRPTNLILEALDANKDGIIEAEEIAHAHEALKTLDTNRDGKLTPNEYRPPRLGGPGNFQGPAGPAWRGGPGGEAPPQRPPQEP